MHVGEGFPEEATFELSVEGLVKDNKIGMCVWSEAGCFRLKGSLGKGKEI